MPCSAKFSMTLQIEILSTETSGFLKLKSFNSVLTVNRNFQILSFEIELLLRMEANMNMAEIACSESIITI